MTKSRKAPPAAKRTGDPNALRVTDDGKASKERRLAEVGLDPAASAAMTVRTFSRNTFGELGVTELFEAIRADADRIKAGDLSGPEAMLAGQAASLNAIFVELARRSALNMGEYLNAAERYMRLALKAQAQCRATLETLAAIKNPPVVYARQANIAAGPQQVNNDMMPADAAMPSPARADASESVPNKLLEAEHGLDLGTPGTAGGGDPSLAAVGTLDGAAHG